MPTKFSARLLPALMLALPIAALAADKLDPTPALQTETERFSYAIGVDLATNLLQAREFIDVDALTAGIRAQFSGATPTLTPEQRAEVKRVVSEKIQQARQAAKLALAESNKAEGLAFLAANKQRKEVRSTASGLQYEVLGALPSKLKPKRPTSSNTVTVNYKGSLLNGDVFDSSYARGEPAVFGLNSVIPGWTEGLQLMAVGEKFRFFVPSELGYGEQGANDRIGPNAVLTFEVELIAIE